MNIDYQSIRSYAETLDGKVLFTKARRSSFLVNAGKTYLEFIPQSSGISRKQPKLEIEKVLSRYNDTGSLQSKYYHDITYHSVYILTIIDGYIQSL